jgi:tRNA(Ile)-lysidine synthase
VQLARGVTGRLALGLSGGGDSLALLHALRAAFPTAELHALIVDHGLREESAADAAFASEAATAVGAQAEILRWNAPRPGQGHARLARHHLLAEACAARKIHLLCLAHTLDDRIETLRMRATRPGGEARLTGPDRFDPSPIWPEGAGLTLARPFLGLRRLQLRAYLAALGAKWLEDPSNEDLSYERVRLRREAWPQGDERERALLARSDQALAARAQRRKDASTLIETGAEPAPWGGYSLSRAAFSKADPATAHLAMESLMLAVSGQGGVPTPKQTKALLTALLGREAATAAGAALTETGVLGRDPGAALGRSDGAPGAGALRFQPGQCAVFDGRWRVRAHRPITISSWGEAARSAKAVPAALRPGLMAAFDPETGKCLALPGVNATDAAEFEQLAPQRIAMRLLPPAVPTWFDSYQCVRNVEARLAKSGSTPNITI